MKTKFLILAGLLFVTALPVFTAGPIEQNAQAQAPAVRYSLQAGSYKDKAAAMAEVKKLRDKIVGSHVFTVNDAAGQTWFAVRIGEYRDLPSATKAAQALSASTGETFTVRPADKL